jgi:hypothetical protein
MPLRLSALIWRSNFRRSSSLCRALMPGMGFHFLSAAFSLRSFARYRLMVIFRAARLLDSVGFALTGFLLALFRPLLSLVRAISSIAHAMASASEVKLGILCRLRQLGGRGCSKSSFEDKVVISEETQKKLYIGFLQAISVSHSKSIRFEAVSKFEEALRIPSSSSIRFLANDTSRAVRIPYGKDNSDSHHFLSLTPKGRDNDLIVPRRGQLQNL